MLIILLKRFLEELINKERKKENKNGWAIFPSWAAHTSICGPYWAATSPCKAPPGLPRHDERVIGATPRTGTLLRLAGLIRQAAWVWTGVTLGFILSVSPATSGGGAEQLPELCVARRRAPSVFYFFLYFVFATSVYKLHITLCCVLQYNTYAYKIVLVQTHVVLLVTCVLCISCNPDVY